MLNSISTFPITFTGLMITLASTLIVGILTTLVFSFKNRMSPSLSLTLAVLPVAMSMIVIMINGNLGIAVAVAGGFTLVRFRSIAGTGREISAVFTVMTLGVIFGMGYVGIGVIFFVVISAMVLVLTAINFGGNSMYKLLRITIPEDYDYVGLFDDVFKKHGIKASLERIKTTNMGSLIDVSYRATIPGGTLSKEALDELRTKNGNLSIMVANYEGERDKL